MNVLLFSCLIIIALFLALSTLKSLPSLFRTTWLWQVLTPNYILETYFDGDSFESKALNKDKQWFNWIGAQILHISCIGEQCSHQIFLLFELNFQKKKLSYSKLIGLVDWSKLNGIRKWKLKNSFNDFSFWKYSDRQFGVVNVIRFDHVIFFL